MTEAMRNVTMDPELRALIPPLSLEELQGLEASLLAEGCREPLLVWQGHNILLDGHHRYALCTKHRIPVRYRDIDLPDRNAAKVWMIQNQLGRRNLTPGQRARLALTLKPLLVAQSMARQAQNLKKGQCFPEVGKVPTSGKAVDALARIAGVSTHTIDKVETVVNSGNANVATALNDGTISVAEAYRQVTESPVHSPTAPTSAADGKATSVNAHGDQPTDQVGKPLLTDKPAILDAFNRRDEMVHLMTEISRLKTSILKRCESGDPLYSCLVATRVKANCENLRRHIRSSMPYAVCPHCAAGTRGAMESCKACNGRGWVGEETYKTAPQELKQ